MFPQLFPLASPSLPPSLSHPSRWSQSTELISLCYAVASHQLSILHLVLYICPCHSLTLSQLTLPPPHILINTVLKATFPSYPCKNQGPGLSTGHWGRSMDKRCGHKSTYGTLRIDCIICGAPVKNENVRPFTQKLKFQDSYSRALNQIQALLSGEWVGGWGLCYYPGCMPWSPSRSSLALETPKILCGVVAL